jgi:hypothetical protein
MRANLIIVSYSYPSSVKSIIYISGLNNYPTQEATAIFAEIFIPPLIYPLDISVLVSKSKTPASKYYLTYYGLRPFYAF